MLPAKPILLLLDGLEHEGRGVHGLLYGGQFAVLLEVDAAVRAQQDILPAPVVPVFGGCGKRGAVGYRLKNQPKVGTETEEGKRA